MTDAVAKWGDSEPASVQTVRGLARLVMSRSTTVVLPVRVPRMRVAVAGMAPVQDPTVLGVPPGVAVGSAVGEPLGVGGGAVVGAVAGFGEGLAPPIPGTEQAPRRSSTANPAANLPALATSTGDNLTGKRPEGNGLLATARRQVVEGDVGADIVTGRN